jgi:aryl-alcohol dehydrogenase-like predicted oxidoreductase|tara:strand:- start:635 stop:1504 length:870 start_codon:yes stop_codon:yes gene_type:complete
MKIALGSAQFGLSYGVANIAGKVGFTEALKIRDVALANNVDTVDTAVAYGNSEDALGSIGVDNFKVVTKLPAIPENISDIHGWVHAQIKASLKRLKKESLYGLLMHDPRSLSGNHAHEIVEALETLKASGIVSKIGVSVYNPADLEGISRIMSLDLVQAPLNVVDRRLITSGWLKRLANSGVEVHTRSSFLQGLLLLPRVKIPKKFEIWSALWDFWHYELIKRDLNPVEACLRYVMSVSQVDRVIVGVETASQLGEIITAVNRTNISTDWSPMACDDENLINPSNWDRT